MSEAIENEGEAHQTRILMEEFKRVTIQLFLSSSPLYESDPCNCAAAVVLKHQKSLPSRVWFDTSERHSRAFKIALLLADFTENPFPRPAYLSLTTLTYISYIERVDEPKHRNPKVNVDVELTNVLLRPVVTVLFLMLVLS